jgi:hypothetical protein
VAGRIDCGSRGRAARIASLQLVEEAGARRSVNGSIDAAATAQRAVRSVGDRVHSLTRDIADGQLEAPLTELPRVSLGA